MQRYLLSPCMEVGCLCYHWRPRALFIGGCLTNLSSLWVSHLHGLLVVVQHKRVMMGLKGQRNNPETVGGSGWLAAHIIAVQKLAMPRLMG